MDIVVFSGTTEGRIISEYLSDNRVNHRVCVATDSGLSVMKESEFAKLHVGRMDYEEIEDYINICYGNNLCNVIIIDATHPYAALISQNLKKLCNEKSIKYIRVLRTMSDNLRQNGINKDENDKAFDTVPVQSEYHYNNLGECLECLEGLKGNILMTTGSKELYLVNSHRELLDRLYVRVLPSIQSLNLCKAAGIEEKKIIAMYGPHIEEMNRAIIKQYNIKHLVTKMSGICGGFDEKLFAAAGENVQLHIIDRPKEDEGISPKECIAYLREEINKFNTPSFGVNITLAGIGMGSDEMMSIGCKKAISEADILFGARRMLERYLDSHVCVEAYTANQIIPYLENAAKRSSTKVINAVVLFSGDTGIYSGASKMYSALTASKVAEKVTILPGISAFSAFSARLFGSYQGAYLESLHGKNHDRANLERIRKLILSGEKVYILMSDKSDLYLLHDLLCSEKSSMPADIDSMKEFTDQKEDALLDELRIAIGFNLSYSNEKILRCSLHNMKAAISDLEEGLYIVMTERKK